MQQWLGTRKKKFFFLIIRKQSITVTLMQVCETKPNSLIVCESLNLQAYLFQPLCKNIHFDSLHNPYLQYSITFKFNPIKMKEYAVIHFHI